ncbi:hypothetical protein MPH47_18055 [Psychrobacillus psychrodurans]|uniref:hypothetical protein n=1 Tax=Psychrobacillus psychrodurans TaxID=126157 RepID=UPI001F4E153B|nr:hypothetical protein [Psychrobacillus psychrodurans]MCK1999102.1 hypothetical protein [Psychrobacillus psychrodurans]
MESLVKIIVADNLNDELERQIQKIHQISPYLYAFIIIIIVQYDWFRVQLAGVGQYFMMGFIYLVITYELFRSFQIKKQVKLIRKI